MIQCPNCSRTQELSVAIWDCGFDLETSRTKLDAQNRVKNEFERPYRLLNIYIPVLRITGWLPMLGRAIGAWSYYTNEEALLVPVMIFLGGLIAAVPYFAFAEALVILLDIRAAQGR